MNPYGPAVPPPFPASPPEKFLGHDPANLLAAGLRTPVHPARVAAWIPPSAERLAQLLPQYGIAEMIGRGGMGAVYKGIQPALDRPVAIKLLPAEFVDDEFIVRFQREARMLAKLHHSGIVAIHDSGQTAEGHFFFVMEFVDGTDLARIIKSSTLTPAQALELTVQICGALHYAHTHGVIHRDIKPANILVTRDGHAKIADFGLARPVHEDAAALTLSNVVIGTPEYMAPEQREGHADQRADIYALGVLLYEMLTGKRPRGVFDPPSFKAQVDVRLDQVVLKAMQEKPERRYQQVDEMGTEVDHIRKTPLPVALPTARKAAEILLVGASSEGAREPGRGNSRLGIAAAVVLPLLSIGGFSAWNAHRQSQEDGKHATVVSGGGAEPIGLLVATQTHPFVNSLGMNFVPVAITGGPTGGQRVLFSVWETRIQDYEVFVKETNREWRKPDFMQEATHPAVNVSWEDAQAFCSWLTDREKKSGMLGAKGIYRLPTDHEWSCAVGIGEDEDATQLPSEKNQQLADVFPWGSVWPPPIDSGNYAGEEAQSALASGKFNYIKALIAGYHDGHVHTAPTGSFPPDGPGLYDLSGNAYEWCEDWYDSTRMERVLRGGSWYNCGRGSLLSSYRGHGSPEVRYNSGFRCVAAQAP